MGIHMHVTCCAQRCEGMGLAGLPHHGPSTAYTGHGCVCTPLGDMCHVRSWVHEPVRPLQHIAEAVRRVCVSIGVVVLGGHMRMGSVQCGWLASRQFTSGAIRIEVLWVLASHSGELRRQIMAHGGRCLHLVMCMHPCPRHHTPSRIRDCVHTGRGACVRLVPTCPGSRFTPSLRCDTLDAWGQCVGTRHTWEWVGECALSCVVRSLPV